MWRQVLYSDMQKVGGRWQCVSCHSFGLGFRTTTPVVIDHTTDNNIFFLYFVTLENFTLIPQPSLLTYKPHTLAIVKLHICWSNLMLLSCIFVCCQVGKLLMENAQLALQSDSMKSRAAAIQARSAGFSCSFPEKSNTPLPQSVRSTSSWWVYRHEITNAGATLNRRYWHDISTY